MKNWLFPPEAVQLCMFAETLSWYSLFALAPSLPPKPALNDDGTYSSPASWVAASLRDPIGRAARQRYLRDWTLEDNRRSLLYALLYHSAELKLLTTFNDQLLMVKFFDIASGTEIH